MSKTIVTIVVIDEEPASTGGRVGVAIAVPPASLYP
jgi:hypothetical protein